MFTGDDLTDLRNRLLPLCVLALTGPPHVSYLIAEFWKKYFSQKPSSMKYCNFVQMCVLMSVSIYPHTPPRLLLEKKPWDNLSFSSSFTNHCF